MPIITPPKISRNPNPSPNVIPATHMAGEDGNKKVGNIATEANSKTASIGVQNVLLTQLITGIITCKRKSH